MHRLVNQLLFLYSYNIIEKHFENFKMATKMASRIRNNMAATIVSSAYFIKTSTIIFNYVNTSVAGSFLINKWVALYFGYWNTFREIDFSFWYVYFLRVFGMTTNVRQLRYCFYIEETCKYFARGRLIFGKL